MDMAVQATSRQDGQLLLRIANVSGPVRAAALLKKFPELAPAAVKHPAIAHISPKNDFTFTPGNELNELEEKLAVVTAHRRLENKWEEEVAGAGTLREALEGDFKKLRVSDQAMCILAEAMHTSILKAVDKKAYEHDSSKANKVCRAAVRYQVKAMNEHAKVADADAVNQLDSAAADYWVVVRRILARAKSPKKFVLGWGKASPVHEAPETAYGCTIECAGLGMVLACVGDWKLLLTWEEFELKIQTYSILTPNFGDSPIIAIQTLSRFLPWS